MQEKKGINIMMNEMKNGVLIYNDKSYDFDFATSLSAHEKQAFVRNVVNSLISDNGYDVVLRDLIFDFVLIDTFTNIDTSFINMKDEDGDDINPIILIEHFLTETNVVDVIKANMKEGLLEELNHAVDLNIQYLTGIHLNPFNEALSSLIATLEKKVNEVDLDSAMQMAQKFAGMTGDLNVDSIVNAYMNSDVHKKNLEDIAEAKSQDNVLG
jgi:hypothetical protein